MTIPVLKLKPKKHNRVRGGHLWIFKDELAEHAEIPAGSIVRVHTDYDYDLGVGFYNPISQFAVRLLLWHDDIDESFFAERISAALRLRERLFPNENTYRLVFGESDFLPGLIIDRYNDYFAIQLLSAGTEAKKQEIIYALRMLFPQLKGVIAKNDSQLREKEGLEKTEEVLFGEIPDEIYASENNVILAISLTHGQKTGYFLDQRFNRKFVGELARGMRVLDCFTNQGGFALHAALGGAVESTGIDISEQAIESCKKNAALNNLSNCTFIKEDVFDFLKEAAQSGKKWDMIILDPPAFTKSKQNIPQAKRGYSEINRQALRCIPAGGFLASSSCSHHISEELFLDIIQEEAKRINRKLKIVFRGMQSPCHPIYLPMPETRYLKFFVFEVI